MALCTARIWSEPSQSRCRPTTPTAPPGSLRNFCGSSDMGKFCHDHGGERNEEDDLHHRKKKRDHSESAAFAMDETGRFFPAVDHEKDAQWRGNGKNRP